MVGRRNVFPFVLRLHFFGSAYLKEKSRTERAEIELGLFKERFRNEIRKAYRRGFKSALSIKDTENEEKK